MKKILLIVLISTFVVFIYIEGMIYKDVFQVPSSVVIAAFIALGLITFGITYYVYRVVRKEELQNREELDKQIIINTEKNKATHSYNPKVEKSLGKANDHTFRKSFDEAINIFEDLITDNLEKGINHFDLSRIYTNYGHTLKERGEYVNAIKCFERAKSLCRKTEDQGLNKYASIERELFICYCLLMSKTKEQKEKEEYEAKAEANKAAYLERNPSGARRIENVAEELMARFQIQINRKLT